MKTEEKLRPAKRYGQGFTLIELLVVIAIIAILAAMLLPVLNSAKKKDQQTYRVNNQKQIVLAFTMYPEDFKNQVLPMDPLLNGSGEYFGGGYYKTPPGDEGDFGWNDFQGLSTEVAQSNVVWALMNTCPLWPYIKNPNSFHCPGDTRVMRSTGTAASGGWAWVTYSKTQNYGGESDGGTFWGAGNTILKTSDITAPAETFCTVEDTDTRGVDVGTWVVNWTRNGTSAGSFTWEDPLGMYHVDTDTWGFTDGHVGTHRWANKQVIQAGLQGAEGVLVDPFPGPTSGTDYNYIRSHYRFPGWY